MLKKDEKKIKLDDKKQGGTSNPIEVLIDERYIDAHSFDTSYSIDWNQLMNTDTETKFSGEQKADGDGEIPEKSIPESQEHEEGVPNKEDINDRDELDDDNEDASRESIPESQEHEEGVPNKEDINDID